jgi:hypothetical protein
MKTIQDTELQMIRDAFHGGGFIDISPEPCPEGWGIQVSDERGNCLAAITLPSKKQALGLIDLLIIS